MLHVTGRDIEEESYALDWDDHLKSWKLLGKAVRANASPPRKRVLDLVYIHPEGLRVTDIANELGRSTSATSELLDNMFKAEVMAVKEGRYFAVPDDM